MSQSESLCIKRVSIIYYANFCIYIAVFKPNGIKKTTKRVRFSNQLVVLSRMVLLAAYLLAL